MLAIWIRKERSMRSLWTNAQIDPERVSSFVTRFNSTTEQACFLIDWLERTSIEDAKQLVASRIMQDDLLYKIGEPYFEGRPKYKTRAADVKSYEECAARLTTDILDEFQKFDIQEAGLPMP
jgi:hypothetical protein